MDIKPSNILVKEHNHGSLKKYKIYLADFGISRSYEKIEDVETDSRTACTRIYAAPEVVRQEARGFGAGSFALDLHICVIRILNIFVDIFSLGCVFLEMLAVACRPTRRHTLVEIRKANPENDWSYQANIDAIVASKAFPTPKSGLIWPDTYLEEAKKMIHPDAQHRPTAEELQNVFCRGSHRCDKGPTPFQVYYKAPLNTTNTIPEEPILHIDELRYPEAEGVFVER